MNKLKLMGDDIALAIVDVGLPDIRGDVLVGELRARHPSLPIVVATGYEDPELRRRFGRMTRVSFMRKPYTQDDLEADRAVSSHDLKPSSSSHVGRGGAGEERIAILMPYGRSLLREGQLRQCCPLSNRRIETMSSVTREIQP